MAEPSSTTEREMALFEASVQFELGVECSEILPSIMLSSHLNFSEIPWHFVCICWFEIPDLENSTNL